MKALFTVLILLPARVFFAVEELPLDYPREGSWKVMPLPDGAKVSLVLPEKVMIGEQMPAKLVIRNEGKTTFEITTGGDYRATGFPQRMKVRVRDSEGKALPELTHANYGMGGGGILVPKTLEPGVSHTIEFPLDRYVSFPNAGKYTVTAGHDLGWMKNETKPHPVGAATIEVTAPTPDQAEELVNSILAGKQATPTHVAFQGKSYPPMREEPMDYVTQAKFCVLRHPVYLSALTKAALNGSVDAVSGIGYIANTEATQILIDLLQNGSSQVLSAALGQLQRRVPSKEDASRPAVHSMWGGDVFQIGPLLPHAWKPEFEATIAAESARLLLHDNPNVVSASASLVQACGTEMAGQAVLDALQKSLDTYRNIPRGDTAALYPPLPEPALLGALDGLRKRGWRSPTPGRTALIVAKFREYADKTLPKPDGEEWKSSMLTWVENGPPTLKEHALKAIPQPLSDTAVKVVLKALEDENPRVLIAACDVARESKRKEFRRPLCQIVEVDRVEQVHRAAIGAAQECGARMELWRTVAQTIIVKELLVSSVGALVQGTIDLPLGGGSGGDSNFTTDQRFAIRACWLEFLTQNEAALSAGKKLPIPDAKTSAKLTGTELRKGNPVVDFSLKDGSRWPLKQK
ncbi:MAG: HEAT repeat domain-containing protein [Verrucomicrobiaceae bacterium]|nr:HEAT repeat domain-containing protein [Verrucomicrobiaceae bacterium]